MTEAQLQAAIIETAQTFGWLVYHTYDSRRSHPGFPDLVLCRPPDVLYLELKSEKGRLRPDQDSWIGALRQSGQNVQVWRPSDWLDGTVMQALKPRVVAR